MKPYKDKLHLPLPTGLHALDEEVELVCTHARQWPPALVRVGADNEAMWRSGEISQHDFQQIETWKKVCGLLDMGFKCHTCPLAQVRRVRAGSGKVEFEALSQVQAKKLTELRRLKKL